MGLRPYQQECLDNIRSAREEGVNKMLCVSPTGTGKAVMLAHIPEQLAMASGDQMMVLVHRKELVTQLADKLREYNPDLRVDVERAEYKADPSADLIVASVQSVGIAKNNEADQEDDFCDRLRKFDPDRLRHLVIDECFVAGTLVDGVPIEQRLAGQPIQCYDHERSAIVRKPITRIFKNRAIALLRVTFSDGRKVVSTWGHPYFIPGAGYTQALFLTRGDMVASIMCYPGTHAKSTSADRNNLHDMRRPGDACSRQLQASQVPEYGKGLLFKDVLEGIPTEIFVRDDGQDQRQICFRSDEEAQPYEQSGMESQGYDDAPSARMETIGTGRQRQAHANSSTVDVGGPGLANGGDRADWQQGQGIAHSLQDRRGQSRPNDRHRGRRRFAFEPRAESAGSEEDHILGVARVESVEILEPGSDGTFGGLCADGFVYNLEVSEHHNYFANGILVHNCHHAAKKNSAYHRVLRYFSIFKPDFRLDDPTKTLVGFTATPGRSDNIGLETILDKIVFSREIRQMMEQGMMINGELHPWLCDIVAYRCETETDISGVDTSRGDFNLGELEDAVNTPARNKLMVDKYLEHGEGATFFTFTVDVAHSVALAEEFTSRGIPTFPVSGKTPDDERRRLLRAFTEGRIRGLVSCGVLSEGIDIPSVGCLLMGRPTKSSLLYRQQIGRGLRPFPAPEEIAAGDTRAQKPHVVVIDFCDVSGRHTLNSVPGLFGLNAGFDAKGKSIKKTVEEAEKAKAKAPTLDLQAYKDLDSIRGVVEKINLFAKPVIPEEIRQFSKLAWVTGMSTGTYQLCLPEKGMLSVKVNTLGQYEVYSHTNGIRKQLTLAGSIKEALAIADKSVPREAAQMLMADAAWRYTPPSEKQIALIKRLYPELRAPFKDDAEFASMICSRYSKGDASSLISQRIGRQ